ncbi:MAG: hypothetical protein R3286_07545 [Gammaproteobacteria bacterium]|nr:hypothetical protein [Gammaproteobacteria bacterium]
MFLLVCALTAVAPGAAAFVLVTPEEAALERAEGEPRRTRGLTPGVRGAPEIVLVKPRPLKNIPAPTDIELKFLPTPPSRIVWDSLRVLYGFLELDVTERVTRHAEKTASGLLAKDAVLPAGSHSITIEISDDRQRVGRKTFELEIESN